MFIAPDGGAHLDPDNFRSRIWTPAVNAAGLAPLRIHDLRHTTASLAIAAGADVKLLQSMLGHASAVMTFDRYGHLMPGRSEDVADRLDVLARAAVSEPVRPAMRLDAPGFWRDGARADLAQSPAGSGGRARRRSGDLPLFRRTLCRLSYSTVLSASRSHDACHASTLGIISGAMQRVLVLRSRRDLNPRPPALQAGVNSRLHHGTSCVCAPPTGFEPVPPP